MKAILLEETGGAENLVQKEIDKPVQKKNEVLIKIKALSINPVDYKVRVNDAVLSAIYGEQRPAILGWDVAGVLEAVGSEVSGFKVGDSVFGMVNFLGAGNAYAEYVTAPENHLAGIPEGTSFEEAAASTLAALTALQVLRDKVKENDRILIHAGSGGVGHFAIQIAKTLGATVISTSSAKNKDFIMRLGADEHIDYNAQAFEEVLSDIDFVFDMFNGEILMNSLKVVKEGGTVVSIPTPEFSEEILALAKSKNINLSFHMVQSSGADMQVIAERLKSGALIPHVSKTFSFNEIAQAHQHVETGRAVGKVIVTL